MFWYFLILTLFPRRVTINIVNSNSTPCLKTPVSRHYMSGNSRTVKGSTAKASTVKASTAIASTVKGSTIKASTVKGKSSPQAL